MNHKCVVFCCIELTDYFFKSIMTFSESYNFICHVISFPTLIDSPYYLEQHSNIIHHNKNDINRRQLWKMCSDINPSLIFVTGWIEKDYIWLAAKFSSQKIPIILSLDNHWANSWKQRIGAFFFKIFLRKIFSNIWIPGKPQRGFAYHLGFKESQIITGLYATDVSHFRKGYSNGKVFRNILFFGRLVPYKRPVELFNLFKSLHKKQFFNWTLTFIGAGECRSKIQQNDQIKIIDFIQPRDLTEHLKQASVFCLPSVREHWGVAVQESCAAGKILLTSDQVGASSDFLIHGFNGFQFKHNNLEEFKHYLIKILEMTDKEIELFQERSFNIEQKHTPEVWAEKLFEVVTKSSLSA